MQRSGAVLGSAVFLVLVPCTVAGLIPWWISRWQFQPAFLGTELSRAVGALLIVAGLPGLLDSFRRFALDGLGTPAPIAPTENLVVTGLYRYVRNPMYVAVAAIILGQALLFGDWHVFVYILIFVVVVHGFVVVYEEPTLADSFGAQFERYRENVPRWIPRLTAWHGTPN